MNVHRNSAPVVDDRNRFVGVDRDGNFLAEPGQGFVDGVVDDLENHVMQARTIVGIADVHPRPLSDGLKAFQYLDILRRIVVLAHPDFLALGDGQL